MSSIVVAIVIAVVAPILLAMITGRQRRLEKREDWRRQDEVAERLLQATNATNGKLNTIKTLVDGKLTAVMRNELQARRLSVAMMEKVIQMNEAQGISATKADLTFIENTKIEIEQLGSTIDDRDAMEYRIGEQLGG